MKRPLLLAALLATSGFVGTTAKAEPLQMFNINTPSAGVVNFSGTGTANFNQSLGIELVTCDYYSHVLTPVPALW